MNVMVIPSQIKTKYIPSGPRMMAESLHIHVGDDFDVKKGDVIILHPKRANKIEIKRKTIDLSITPRVPYSDN